MSYIICGALLNSGVRQSAMPNDGPMDFGGMLIDLSAVEFTPQLLEAIPRHVAWRYRALPISENADGSLDVALADPSDIGAIDSLQHLLKREIQLRLAEENQLAAFLLRLYPHGAGDQR